MGTTRDGKDDESDGGSNEDDRQDYEGDGGSGDRSE